MSSSILSLPSQLDKAFRQAISVVFPGVEADPLLRRSDRCDYQVNAALALAKREKANPKEVAQKIADAVEKDLIEKLEVSGPGFINVTVKGSALATALANLSADPKKGVPIEEKTETVVIDYSSPNVAKDLHVGHLRSTVIGDSLARTLEAVGHKVIRQNHLGDWGTPFGMLIENLVDLGLAGADAELHISDLDAFYKQARGKFDDDDGTHQSGFKERARKRVVSLQGGDEDSLRLWKKLCAESRRYFAATYAKLGITLKDSDVAGESFFGPVLREVIEELRGKGLIKEDQGALCLYPPGFTSKEGEPLPLIVQKSDGGFGYATTDLAAIRYRIQTLKGNRIVYVVGSPQAQHLSMIFAAAKMADWIPEGTRPIHVAFGSVLGQDKKMFKARSGETVKLAALLDEAEERALTVVKEKSQDLSADAQAQVAKAIGVGAVKYFDLSSDRIKDYVFDWDRVLAFEGNTGPYLMYAHARCRSIARKGEAAGVAEKGSFSIEHPAERALALDLIDFSRSVLEVSQSLEPHRLCTYLFATANRFSTFYVECPVLKAPSDQLRDARLRLTELTADVLKQGLGLLGIDAPEKM